MKAIAVSSGIGRSPRLRPLARQIEQGTRTIGLANVLLRLDLFVPEASRSPSHLQLSNNSRTVADNLR